MLEQSPLLLEYQRLDEQWDRLEGEWDEEVQKLLEEIGERQCMILNEVTIQ